jgi:cell division inhibitor SulA
LVYISRRRQAFQKALPAPNEGAALARDRCQAQIKNASSISAHASALLHPQTGVVIRQITDITPGQNQERHASRSEALAVQLSLVMRLISAGKRNVGAIAS